MKKKELYFKELDSLENNKISGIILFLLYYIEGYVEDRELAYKIADYSFDIITCEDFEDISFNIQALAYIIFQNWNDIENHKATKEDIMKVYLYFMKQDIKDLNKRLKEIKKYKRKEK